MMRHPEHHHVPTPAMQRTRMNMQQMGPPAQRMLMTVSGGPHPGVLVSMPSAPTLISHPINPITTLQPKPNMNNVPPQVYYDTMPNEGRDIPVEQASPPQQQPQQTHQHQHQSPQPPIQPQQQTSPPLQSNTQQFNNTNATTISTMPNLANMKEKTPMCLINELARYNKIQHQYKLTNEQGPAHKKIFTVTLKLDNEEYEAEGPSIKKAQHSAAAFALEATQLKHPPPKVARNVRLGSVIRSNPNGIVTPTVELNALAMKRGERTVYIVETPGNTAGVYPQQNYVPQSAYYNRHGMYPAGQQRYNYEARRNHAIRNQYQTSYDNRYCQFKSGTTPGFPPSSGEICTVRLKVGNREYTGTGYTVQAARHDAASKAIEDIKKLSTIPSTAENGQEDSRDNASSTDENTINALHDINTDLKSPISLVHEIALKRQMNVVFEVKSENGPPHMKVFITQCRIGDCVVDGEGNGKKISKKRAAEKMLEKLLKLAPIPSSPNTVQLKRKRVTTKKKTRNLIKVNSDKTDEYEDINPISRLIQIQQAHKEKEPVYTVLEERGVPRRREFVIQAAINDCVATGVGPNKKIAKRNAAQALLTLMGYSTPTPTVPKQTTTITTKPDKEPEPAEKPRKVTFLEEKQETSIGGSAGRQLVPGLFIMGEQQSISNKAKTTTTNYSNDEKSKNQQKVAPPPPLGVRSKDKLLYLAQLMNIQVQFSDFPKANHEMYLTLVSLSTNPPQVCHGEGPTTEASHEKAALEALNVLSEMGLDNTPAK